MKHILIACLVFALCLAVGLFSLFYVAIGLICRVLRLVIFHH